MSDYEVMAENFGRVEVRDYHSELWTPESPEVERLIDHAVEEARKEAETIREELYNGPLVRLMDFEVEDEALSVDLQRTDYFSHLGTRGNPEIAQENRADPLSVGAVLHSDGCIVLGQKSGRVEQGKGEYHIPGSGFIEDPERQYQRSLNAEPSSPIHREIDEEINLSPRQITHPVPEALIGASHRQPMLVYDIETVLSPKELTEEWTQIPSEEREFSELIFLPEDDIKTALDGEKDILVSHNGEVEKTRYDGEMRPHAEGALSLI